MEEFQNNSKVLLQRLKEGETEAAELFFHRYWPQLLNELQCRVVGRMQAKIDAEDLAQEAFADFFKQARAGKVVWREPGDLWRLLATIGIRKSINAIEHFQTKKRKINIEREHDESIQSLVSAQSSDDFAAIELKDTIHSIVEKEKPILKRIAHLTLAGYSEREISLQIRRSVRTVRRLRAVLRDRLAAAYGITLLRDHLLLETTTKAISLQHYQLNRLAGQGSYSMVYNATHLTSQEPCFIKLIQKRWANNAQITDLFRREATALTKLELPECPKLHGLGQIDQTKQVFLALDSCGSIPVLDFIIRSSDSVELVDIVANFCRAFDHMHKLEWKHGDIKPEHLLITPDGNARLIDFAFAVHPTMPWDGQSLGTEAYLPPERLASKSSPPTYEGDYFSFGKSLSDICSVFPIQSSITVQNLHQIALQMSNPDPKQRMSFHGCLQELHSIPGKR